MFTLKSAKMFYGASGYDLHDLDVPQTISCLEDVDLDRVARALQRQNPSLGVAGYRARIKIGQTPAYPEFNLPSFISVYGDGFNIAWAEA